MRDNPPPHVVLALLPEAQPNKPLRYMKGNTRCIVRAPTVACLKEFLDKFEGYSQLQEPFTW